MNSHGKEGNGGEVAGFRWRLFWAVALVVSASTAAGIYAAERNALSRAGRDADEAFHLALAANDRMRETRSAEISSRCDALARNPRIHAALEDDAIDLLYPNARDELRNLLAGERATFYRFLDAQGAVIAPPPDAQAGMLTPGEEKELAISTLPDTRQTGCLVRGNGDIDEIISVPIRSSVTGETIAALLAGFQPSDPGTQPGAGLLTGIWRPGALYLPALGKPALAELSQAINLATANRDNSENQFQVQLQGARWLVSLHPLNPGSVFEKADEICLYPLAESLAAQRQLRWRIGGAGALALVGALLAIHFLSRRLSAPMERLAFRSAENETALKAANHDLQRAARFSADASHQLKTPLTVLRAGLEEILTQDEIMDSTREELSDLILQTCRLNGVIETLLLLSRVDAGRLRLEDAPVDLNHVIAICLDDLSALPDALRLRVDTCLPPELWIAGEIRYTSLILQNLLENARKYNRPNGRIAVNARVDGIRGVALNVGNTGPGILPEAQESIFERFHRGVIGENIPGHGLGLNLARELARLHGGDLRLVCSGEDWTEFEVTFRLCAAPAS